MDCFVDAKSFAIPFKMNSSLLGSHLTVFGNILVSLQIISYQVYIEIVITVFLIVKLEVVFLSC